MISLCFANARFSVRHQVDQQTVFFLTGNLPDLIKHDRESLCFQTLHDFEVMHVSSVLPTNHAAQAAVQMDRWFHADEESNTR